MRRLEVDAAETSDMGRVVLEGSTGMLLLRLESVSFMPIENRGCEEDPSWDFVLEVRERMVV